MGAPNYRSPASGLATAILRRAWWDCEYISHGHIPHYVLPLRKQRALDKTPEGRKELRKAFRDLCKDLDSFTAGTWFKILADVIGGDWAQMRKQYRTRVVGAKLLMVRRGWAVRVPPPLKKGEKRAAWLEDLMRAEEEG